MPEAPAPARTLVIACGALAREIGALRRQHAWLDLDVRCLPAELHNFPDKIAPAVREAIERYRGEYAHILVGYGDCGTGGALDAVLQQAGVERIPGAHCYEFFAGASAFDRLHQAELGTFYLTDFLLRHYERLVHQGLGLDRHPELAAVYFAHYRKLVYLAQAPGPGDADRARAIATRMGWTFEMVETGYGELGTRLDALQRHALPLPIVVESTAQAPAP